MKIGVIENPHSNWTAGSVLTDTLTRSLASAAGKDDEIFSISASDTAVDGVRTLRQLRWDPLPGEARLLDRLGLARDLPLPGETALRSALGLRDRTNPYSLAAEHGLDVLLPVHGVPRRTHGVRSIGWIPDFQHVLLPQQFSEVERRGRDHDFRQLAGRADRILLSSKAVLADFVQRYPGSAGKARAISFVSRFAHFPVEQPPGMAIARYRLPQKFALVVNQFWSHKNHAVVVDALVRLKKAGLRIPFVLTGLPSDYRDPRNGTLSRLLQAIAEGGVREEVTVLGFVERAQLNDLLRCAAVIVQPSLCEGWNTTVEDAKALGRPLLCSDLAVHREQAPSALGFFPPEDGSALAELLSAHWPGLNPGPDPDHETKSLKAAREAGREYGRLMLDLCHEAARR